MEIVHSIDTPKTLYCHSVRVRDSLCGVNRTCWTIGSRRCCLCLNFEFNPRWARDNLSASWWVICLFPQPEKTTLIVMYVCVRVCVHAYTHACMSVSMHVCLSARKRLLWYCTIFTARRITSHTNMLYAKTQFTAKGNI